MRAYPPRAHDACREHPDGRDKEEQGLFCPKRFPNRQSKTSMQSPDRGPDQ